MAQVPYDPTSSVAPEQRAPDDYVRAQASPQAFGAGVAQGAEALGKGAVSAGTHWEEIQTDDMSNQAQKAGNDLVESFKTKYGQNALDAQDKTRQGLEDVYNSYKDKLASPEQGLQFDKTNRPFFDRYLTGNLNTHANEQGLQFQVKTTNDAMGVANTMAATAGSAGSEKDAGVAYTKALSAASKKLQIMGQDRDPDAISAAKDSAASTLKSYAEALSVKDPAKALDFVERNKDKFGTLYEPVFKSIQEGAHQAQGRSFVADKLAQGPQPTTVATGGARNNNPGNIIDGAWAKSQPGYTGSNGRFAVFDSTASGAAAMGKNLASYATQGVATLNQLTAKWAPAGDGANDPGAYARTIAAATGIDPNTPINLADPAIQAKIIPAMARVEQGHAVAGITGSTGGVAQPASRVALGAHPQPFGQPTIPEQASAAPAAPSADASVEPAAFTTQPLPQQQAGESPEDMRARITKEIADSGLPYGAQQAAYRELEQTYTKAQIAAEQDTKAKREEKEGVLNDINGTLRTGDPQQAYAKLNDALNNHKIDETEFASVSDVIKKRAGVDNPVTMGKGYDALFKRMLLPSGDSNRITDPMDVIRAEQQGDVTERGSNRLQENLARMKKDYKSFGDQMRVSNLQKTLKEKLTYANEANGLRDQTGTDIYEQQALPALLDQIDQWTGSGESLSKMPILSDPKQMKAFVDQYRNDRDKEKAKQAEVNEILGGTRLPSAPENTDATYWTSLMQSPPISHGARASPQDWSRALNILVSNPTPETVAAFNKRFGRGGYQGGQILKSLLGDKYTGSVEPPPSAPVQNPLYQPNPGIF